MPHRTSPSAKRFTRPTFYSRIAQKSGERSKRVDSVGDYLREYKKIKLLPVEQQKELYRRYLKGDEQAKQEFIFQLIRYVIFAAKKELRKRGMNIQQHITDYVSIGVIQIIEAVDKKQYDTKFAPTTYFGRIAKRAISDNLKTHTFISTPSGMIDVLSNYVRASSKFYAQHGKDISLKQAAKQIGVSEARLRQVLETKKRTTTISLDFLTGEGIELGRRFFPTLDLNKPLMLGKLRKAMETLSEKEKKIIAVRYGFGGQGAMSFRDAGKVLGMKYQRVEQMEKDIIKKLRKALNVQINKQ